MQAERELWRSLGERLLVVARALAAAGIPHAFGGAIAYNYVGEPRGTRDIDVNIFLPPANSDSTLHALKEAGVPVDVERAKQTIARTGQDRIKWEHIPIDLFFSTVPFHDSSEARVRHVPFRGLTIPVLAAEDIALCKIAFNRESDWLDLRNILAIQQARFDLDYTRRWLYDMFPPDDERVQRFERLVSQLTDYDVL